jgi:hypothetical protein
MSRRHRGRPHHHAPAGADGSRRSASVEPAGSTAHEATTPRTAAAAPPRIQSPATQRGPEPRANHAADVVAGLSNGAPVSSSGAPVPPNGAPAAPLDGPAHVPHQQNGDRLAQCTAPQLRRFIKSRPYVPMHELRRRFSIDGGDDDVTPVRINPGWIYVGLPTHEGHLLGELLRTGEIGYELSLDPRTPIVIGVYPMRPIPRT